MKILPLIRYLFDGPRMRSLILKKIILHEHILSMIESDKNERMIRWILRERTIIEILKDLL
jgi:hypothetical protein